MQGVILKSDWGLQEARKEPGHLQQLNLRKFYRKSRQQIQIILGLGIFHKSHKEVDRINLFWFDLINSVELLTLLPQNTTTLRCSSLFSFCCCHLLLCPPEWLTCTYLGDTEVFPNQMVPIIETKFKDLKFQGIQQKQMSKYRHLEMGLSDP